MRHWLATILVAVALGWPSPVPAHRSVARELVVQLDERGAVALWHVRMVGPKAKMMAAVWDRDRNGALDDGESAGVAVSLLAGAARGITLTWDGQPLRTSALEPRLDSVGERSLAAVGLATLSLPTPPRPGAHVLRIEVDEKSGPLALQLQVVHAWQLADSAIELAEDERGFARPLWLSPGRSVELKVTATTGSDRAP